MLSRTRLPLVVLVLAVPQALWAQYRPNQGRPNLNDLRDFSESGTVEGVQGDVVSMKLAAGHPYFIKLQAGLTKVSVTGTAKPDYLKPGTLVSFTADIPQGKEVGSSRVDLQACKLEYSIVSPK